MLQKCYQCQLIPYAFVALVLENELQYHGLAVLINSINDATISRENFLKFGPVSPELTKLICERQVRHGQKTGVCHRISLDILDPIFAMFSSHESTLRADDGSVPYFPICQGMLPWQPNNVA